MKQFKADLHIHTCLSPCGDLDMLPPLIIKQALKAGLDIIGICDHNSAENVSAVIEASSGTKVKVIGGIEITTKEEVHILALAEDTASLKKIQETVYKNLDGKNDPDTFGEQVIVNKDGDPIDISNKLLIGSTKLSLEEVIKIIHKHDGLAIAAHIDREGFGIISQIGFIPDDLPLDGIEVTSPDFTSRLPSTQGFECSVARRVKTGIFATILSSDAHSLDDIGKKYSKFFIEEASFEEIKKALRKEAGRRIEI